MEINSRGKPEDLNRIWLPSEKTQLGSDNMVKSMPRIDLNPDHFSNFGSQQVLVDTGFSRRIHNNVLHVISSPFNDRTTIIFRQENKTYVSSYATSKNIFYIQCNNP